MKTATSKSLLIGMRPRAQRIAFLVPVDPALDTLRKIGYYCSNVWGGLETIIVEMENDKIVSDGWRLLELYDPDLIYSFAGVSDNLAYQLNDRILPARLIAQHDNFFKRDYVNSWNTGLEGILNHIISYSKNNDELILIPNTSPNDECYDEVLFNLGLLFADSHSIINPYINSVFVNTFDAHQSSDLLAELKSFAAKRIQFPLERSSPLGLTSRFNTPKVPTYLKKDVLEIYIFNSSSDIIKFWNNRAIYLTDRFFRYNSLLLKEDSFIRFTGSSRVESGKHVD